MHPLQPTSGRWGSRLTTRSAQAAICAAPRECTTVQTVSNKVTIRGCGLSWRAALFAHSCVCPAVIIVPRVGHASVGPIKDKRVKLVADAPLVQCVVPPQSTNVEQCGMGDNSPGGAPRGRDI